MQLIIIQNMTCQILLRALRCFLSEGLQARSTHIICFGYIQIFKTYIIRLCAILQHTHTHTHSNPSYITMTCWHRLAPFVTQQLTIIYAINYQLSIGFNIHHLSFHGVQQGSSQLQVLTHPCHNNVMLDLKDTQMSLIRGSASSQHTRLCATCNTHAHKSL